MKIIECLSLTDLVMVKQTETEIEIVKSGTYMLPNIY